MENYETKKYEFAFPYICHTNHPPWKTGTTNVEGLQSEEVSVCFLIYIPFKSWEGGVKFCNRLKKKLLLLGPHNFLIINITSYMATKLDATYQATKHP